MKRLTRAVIVLALVWTFLAIWLVEVYRAYV